MEELYEKSIKKLELDRVLHMLAECAGSAEGKVACVNLKPVSDLEDVETLLSETTAAVNLSTRKGYPGFSGVQNVGEILDRADRGGVLQPKELLAVAGVLRCTRTTKDYVQDEDDETVLDPYFLQLTPNKYLEERIFYHTMSTANLPEDTIQSDNPQVRGHPQKTGYDQHEEH